MSTGRRGARRAALFVLYQWDVTGQPLASLYEGDLDAYTKELAEGVAAEVDDLDATIGDASSDWRPERLGALERNILRIADLLSLQVERSSGPDGPEHDELRQDLGEEIDRQLALALLRV